ESEIALVLAVFVVDYEDHLTAPDSAEGVVDRSEGHAHIPPGLGGPPPMSWGLACGPSSTGPGMVATMRPPWGSLASTWISPPWSSAIHRAIARPRPAPPAVDDRAVSAR